MDESTQKEFLQMDEPSFLNTSSSSDEAEVEPDNMARRVGMRFTSIEDFLGSLNTATTAVTALQGMKTLSVENYQKIMPGAQLDEPAGDFIPPPKPSVSEDLKDGEPTDEAKQNED
ncbi:hypothetical protein AWZ03_013250 [Drosophila navojoa]|uniref:Uncharacterized protein n=1 Tax=Drosophila navojoa TaxID=7232 RepID=A0A484AWS2_DRONA|nr:hypothetical protein AWZ03_013250 [Drosophila navojoa]